MHLAEFGTFWLQHISISLAAATGTNTSSGGTSSSGGKGKLIPRENQRLSRGKCTANPPAACDFLCLIDSIACDIQWAVLSGSTQRQSMTGAATLDMDMDRSHYTPSRHYPLSSQLPSGVTHRTADSPKAPARVAGSSRQSAS
jgi:hypothetical protein